MKKLIITTITVLCFVNLIFSQCYDDRHSTNADDGWISCNLTANPVLPNTNSHWIMYNFGTTEFLFKSKIWNVNHPEHLDNGIQNAFIHYSLDSINWTYFGSTNFPQASGNYLYEGFEGPNFGGIQAKFLLISATSNYGGDCYGFGELKIFTEPEPTNAFQLTLNPCENEGVLYGLSGNIEKDGTYSGNGIINSYGNQFDFDPYIAGAGTHTISFTYNNNGSEVTETANINIKSCTDASCLNCAPCGTTPQFVLNSDPVPNGLYQQKEIVTQGKVNNYYDVDLKGENFVAMENNFETESNLNYLADIKNCDDSNLPVNLMNNGSFETGDFTGWNLFITAQALATQTIVSDNVFNGDYAARVDIQFSTGQPSWHIQFMNDVGSANLNQEYVVKFAAKASVQTDLDFWIGKDTTPYNIYEVYYDMPITTEWQQFTVLFTPDEQNNGELRIAPQLGNTIGSGTFWFDSFEMYENN